MLLKELLNLESGVKGLRSGIVKVEKVMDVVNHPEGKNGAWSSQSFEISDSSDKAWVQTSDFELEKSMVNKLIELSGVSINEYTGKDGKQHKNLKAKQWSEPNIQQPEKSESLVNKVLQNKTDNIAKDTLSLVEKNQIWEDKDRRMVRMNALSHATEIIRSFIQEDGTPEHYAMEVKKLADIFEDYIYNGLSKDAEGIPF